jgi:hypothetical protein
MPTRLWFSGEGERPGVVIAQKTAAGQDRRLDVERNTQLIDDEPGLQTGDEPCARLRPGGG